MCDGVCVICMCVCVIYVYTHMLGGKMGGLHYVHRCDIHVRCDRH